MKTRAVALLIIAWMTTWSKLQAAELVEGKGESTSYSSVLTDPGEDPAVIENTMVAKIKEFRAKHPDGKITIVCQEGGPYVPDSCKNQEKALSAIAGLGAIGFLAMAVPDTSKPGTPPLIAQSPGTALPEETASPPPAPATEKAPAEQPGPGPVKAADQAAPPPATGPPTPGAPKTKYEKIRNFLRIATGPVYGGAIGLTMAIGQIHAHSNPLTVAAAGIIGLGVGGGYAQFLVNKDAPIRRFMLKGGFPFGRMWRQALVPLGLGVLLNVAMGITHAVLPEVTLGRDFMQQSMFQRIGELSLKSTFFQFFWQNLTSEIIARAIANDPAQKEKYETRGKITTFSMLQALAVTNGILISGYKDLNNLIVGVVGTAGLLTYLKYKINNPAQMAISVAAGIWGQLKSLPGKAVQGCQIAYGAIARARPRQSPPPPATPR